MAGSMSLICEIAEAFCRLTVEQQLVALEKARELALEYKAREAAEKTEATNG